ncbi:E3 SUMO-protein ligase ZBED1-like [Zophobas morio]|uniref:E3 SUMO-protein ligase ZBED1-like n=1 Tax=Zophobas morio TaxID=2755281 RepID=UPI003083EAFE
MSMPTSKSIKRYFTKIDAISSRCRFCLKIVKNHSNTTNLLSHMKRKHPMIPLNQKSIMNVESKSEQEEPCKKRQCFEKPTSPIIQSEPGCSGSRTIERSCDNISNLSEATTLSILDSSSFSHIKGKQKKVTEVFEEVSSYTEGGRNASKITNAILYMLAVDNMPLKTVENKGFKKFLQTTLPLYKLPCRKTFTNMMDERYEVISSQIKEDFKNVLNFTITTDIWTDSFNTRSFMGITVHFFNMGELKSVNIGVIMLEKSHTGEYICEKLNDLCVQWNIDKEKVTAIVTDNGSNVVKGAYLCFGKKKHLPCFAHTLNLVVTNALKLTTHLSDIINKVKEIVAFFKHSTKATEELKSQQIQNGAPNNKTLKLIQQCETRWNSTYLMLQRFLLLATYISSVLFNYKNPTMVNHDEIEILEEVVLILKPFQLLTTEISGEKYVTASKIIPLAHCLKLSLNRLDGSTEFGKELITNLGNEVQKRFYSEESFIERNEILAVATVIDPRFKKIHFESARSLSNTLNIISKMFPTKTREVDSEGFFKPVSDNSNDIWNIHENLVVSKESRISDVNSGNGLPTELKQYLDQSIIARNDDPIQYFKQLKIAFPELYKIATKYLSVVGTSVPCERLFSRAGEILADKRSRLTGPHLSNLIFLSSIEDKYWFE